VHIHSPSLPVAAQPSLYVRGLLALRNNDAEDAASLLTRALRREPEHCGVHRNLVRALLLGEHWDQVVIQANAALVGMPDVAELHFAHGTALNALGQHSKACAAFAKALSLQPDHAASWLNMGNASADLDDLESAETLYRTALRLDPALPEAYASLGYILTRQSRLAEAIQAFETAIDRFPDFAPAHWNLAIAALLGGDLKRGFAEYEWRKHHPRYRSDFPILPGPPWDGSDPAGQTILIRAEQGFGDTIQFARYLPLIAAAGGKPVLVCHPSLVPLIGTMAGVTARAHGPTPPAFDTWIDMASLPFVFGTTMETVPYPTAYLRADPVRSEAWRGQLPTGRKVGVVFSGNPRHPDDRRRSIPLELVRLPDIPSLSFIDLHFGEELPRLGLPNLTTWMKDYAETAALIANLDLVVTVDTSVAHLAGALGKPVWILLPHAPDWRWTLGRSDSTWYKSARLFRQQAAGDWTGVLNRAFGALMCSPR
jgi:Flp pilus assembly protein TadD